ncbi:MAG TPA: DUF5131 family protein [Candidatus Bathyarchaeota archaeon]|nr:DUF5131 family protein [Candidatus Bathyarchaeota archaeon]
MFNRRFKPGTLIFVSDMADLFGSWVPSRWIKIVLEHVEKFLQTTFLFLTKNPECYLEFVSQIPSNVVLRATVETDRSYFKHKRYEERLKDMP